MKKGILLSAIISIFLVLSCVSFSAVGNETVTPASKGDSPDLIIEIKSVTFKGYYYQVTVEISNVGTSAVPAGETLNFCVKILSKVKIDDNVTIPLLTFDETFHLSDEIASESLEPQDSINGTIEANCTYPDSIIHVRVDPDDLIYEGEDDSQAENNNTDQFVHKP